VTRLWSRVGLDSQDELLLEGITYANHVRNQPTEVGDQQVGLQDVVNGTLERP
jgi:hypothetical protein